MKKFSYEARDKNGKIIKGQVEAPNKEQAAKLLRSRGYFVIKLDKSQLGFSGLFGGLKNRIGNKQISSFTRQMATMINAGLPITEALSILRLQADQSIQPIITQVLVDIEGGQSLSTALAQHPKVFSPTYIALIKAGETGGILDKVLTRLADNMEKQQEFRGKVKTAMVYPIIIVIAMIIVAAIMLVFVIPRLTDLYSQFDADLPITTRILTGISGIFVRFWPIVLIISVLALWGFNIYKKTAKGKRKISQIVFSIPIVGDLQKEVILTELTRTLSLLIGAGVSILDSLQVSSGVVGNAIMQDSLEDVQNQITKGFPISYSFAQHPDVFPFILSQMMAVGEETGKMDEVLEKLSRVFEINSEQKLKALSSAVEPVVMIILGIGVAFMVISIILPIYNLTTAI